MVVRDWQQFDSQENLAKSVAIEAGEFLECFRWGAEPSLAEVRSQLADVLTYCYLLADAIDANPSDLVVEKLGTTRAKYPVEKARGRSDRYDRLLDRAARLRRGSGQ